MFQDFLLHVCSLFVNINHYYCKIDYTLKNSYLLEHFEKNVTTNAEPRPKLDFNRKYRGCNNESRSEERCNHENWQVDFIIPSSTFPSGLSKVELRNKDFGIDDDVKFW